MSSQKDIQQKQEQMKNKPAQTQSVQPGFESEMKPEPLYDDPSYTGSSKLKGKTALITGGDSGIGRAVAILFAKEGANVSIVYLNEHEDANKTKQLVEEHGASCLLVSGDVGEESFCHDAVKQTVDEFGQLDILVNNLDRTALSRKD